MSDRLDRQLTFLMEAERLNTVIRATAIGSGTRKENSAEHSWHLTLFALVLADQAKPSVDINRVIKMLILHDIVEVDAGDNPLHGDGDRAAQKAAEQKAADRLYGLLPDDQAKSLRAIWDEYEAGESDDAQFARALDRFQPPNLNLANGGGTWTDFNVSLDQIETRVAPAVRRGAPGLWAYLFPKLTAFFGQPSR